MGDIMSRLEGYFDELKSRGGKLPSCSRSPEPHFRAISAAARIALSHLRTEPYKARIVLAARELGLTPREGTQLAERAARFEKNHALLTNYLKWLKDNGLKLPRDPRNQKKIFYPQVAIEAGLSRGALPIKKTDGEPTPTASLLQLIDDAASSLGSEVRVLPQSPGHPRPSFSYQQLIERGTEERRKELKDKPKARQQVYNTRTALNRFRKSLGLEKTAIVGNELASEFKTAVEKATGAIANKSSRKKFQTEIFWWCDFYGRLVKEPAIPDDLNQAIAHLCDRSGLSLSVIAKLIGIDDPLLSVWCNNSKTPSKLSIKPLERMESLFKLPAGTLTNKISRVHSRRFSRPQLPQFLQDDPDLMHRVSKHLPDNFCTLPLERQRAIVDSIRTDILRGDDEYAQRLRVLIRLPYRLKEWPEPALVEFNSYADFKTAETPPPGMNRSGTWRPTTKRKRECEFAFIFGAACLPPDARDERLRGVGFPKSQLTLALIACPPLIEWYLSFRSIVRSQVTEYTISLLRDYISMLRPKTGWLRQSPHLAARLTPFAQGDISYVPQELASRALVDWDGVCDDAIKKYKELISEMKERVTVSRDSFHRIEGLLAHDDPLKPLGILLQEMKRDLPSRHTKPVHYHVGVRDIVLLTLAVVTGFRRTTLVKLDYTGDESGNLYMKDGKYVLHVPRKFFKNENSSFFLVNRVRQDYLDTLPDKYGLYEALKEYLEDSRPFLMKKYPRPTDERPLFVTSASTLRTGRVVETPRLKAERVSAVYSSKVERYLVENKHRGTGIAKVRKTGIHSLRHVRGVKVYRKTRSFKLAGDANQNSEHTAKRHYSRTTIAERNLEVNKVLLEDE
jgi:transcriptional regulator with XRE-family HTH domain